MANMHSSHVFSFSIGLFIIFVVFFSVHAPFHAYAQDSVSRACMENAVNANWPFKFGGPFYSHIFIDKIEADSDVIIPCQSVFDVQIAARLGFRFIEANVHATATPGKYIVMHGVRGKLGGQVMRTDGSSADDVVIKETPFDELMTGFVYRSKYAKYRTHITSLEEFLIECRRNNIAPMVSFVDAREVDIVRSIMGNNFILYWGTRDQHSGPILEYWTYRTKDEILARCRYMGAPYMYCMGNTGDFSYSELEEICREVHRLGCHIGFAGCYENPVQSERLLGLGMDFSASGWDINEIVSGNLCNLSGDLEFDDFRTGGKVEEHVLHLAPGDKLCPGIKLEPCFLAGGSLHIMFRGKLRVEMGKYIHHEYESDGSRSVWISSYFMEQSPTFSITAVEPTEILTVTYKASKM